MSRNNLQRKGLFVETNQSLFSKNYYSVSMKKVPRYGVIHWYILLDEEHPAAFMYFCIFMKFSNCLHKWYQFLDNVYIRIRYLIMIFFDVLSEIYNEILNVLIWHNIDEILSTVFFSNYICIYACFFVFMCETT